MEPITTQAALDTFCKQVENSAYITIDTEFIRERTYFPKLCLIQVAAPPTADGHAAIIDPLAKDLDLAPLFALLQKQDLLKVFHACRQDVEIFYLLTGKTPTPLFDTQIAASVCGYGDSAGYETLVNKIVKKDIDKSSRFTDWSARPLTEKQLNYALSDVTYLRDIYQKLDSQLQSTDRSGWIEDDHAFVTNPALYDIKPKDAWKRLKYGNMRPKQLAALRELASWREITARKADIPRGHVVKDDALIELAHCLPIKPEDIKQLRRVGKNISQTKQEAILAAVQVALKLDPGQYPKTERPHKLPPEMAGPIAILKLLLKVQSETQGVSASIIGGKEDIESIALGKKDSPALSGWRGELFGKKAVALMEGKLVLSLDPKNKQIVFEEKQDSTIG